MMHSPCPSTWALERYVLQELPADATQVTEHVESCDACRARVAAQRADSAAFLSSATAAKLRRALGARTRTHRERLRWALACVAAAVLALLVWQHGAASKLSHEPKTSAAEELAVLRFQNEWLTAVCNKDVDSLERILADDYTYTDVSGARSSKADSLRSARTAGDGMLSFKTSNVRARVYGDVAVLTGHLAVKGLSRGKPYDAEVMFTDTLARIDGRWRAVAAHVSKASMASPRNRER